MDIYEKAILAFGTKPQLGKLCEECAELIVAIHHFIDGRASELDLASEFADVEIMITQLRYVVNPKLIESEKEKKLKRLDERLNAI